MTAILRPNILELPLPAWLRFHPLSGGIVTGAALLLVRSAVISADTFDSVTSRLNETGTDTDALVARLLNEITQSEEGAR